MTNFIAKVDELKLDYDRVIPIHYPADGRVVTKAELLRNATAGAATN